MITTVNPATGRELESYNETSKTDQDFIIKTLQRGFLNWRLYPVEKRAEKVLKLKEILENNKQELSRLMTLEMGKPIRESQAEIDKSISLVEYYAKESAALLDRRYIAIGDDEAYVQYEPLGVILAVMPWNFPLWQVVRAAIPALMAGNSVLLKHASNVTGSALEIGKMFENAELDEVFQVVVVSGSDVLSIAEDARIAGATLTGSEHAGRSLASVCGQNLKPVVLELGGSDPFIVFEDADLKKAAETAVSSRCINTGQSCIAAKRFIVMESVFSDFIDAFQTEIQSRKIGDPLDSTTELGPLARKDLKIELNDIISRSTNAEMLWRCQDSVSNSNGFYFLPSMWKLENRFIGSEEPVWVEETFGPVAVFVSVIDEKEALRAANDSRFGLGATVFTEDRQRAEMMASQIQSGTVAMNSLLRSDMRLPFGGIKASGFGRELSKEGLHAFVNIKSVRHSL